MRISIVDDQDGDRGELLEMLERKRGRTETRRALLARSMRDLLDAPVKREGERL